MSADLEKMAAAFNTTISALEDELMALILDGQIQARIDSHNKVMFVCVFIYLDACACVCVCYVFGFLVSLSYLSSLYISQREAVASL